MAALPPNHNPPPYAPAQPVNYTTRIAEKEAQILAQEIICANAEQDVIQSTQALQNAMNNRQGNQAARDRRIKEAETQLTHHASLQSRMDNRLTMLQTQLTQLMNQRAIQEKADHPTPNSNVSKLYYFDCPEHKEKSISDVMYWMLRTKLELSSYGIAWKDAYSAIAARMPPRLSVFMKRFEATWKTTILTEQDFSRIFEMEFYKETLNQLQRDQFKTNLLNISFIANVDMDIKGYTSRFETLARITETPPTDADANRAYINGLPTGVRSKIRTMQIVDEAGFKAKYDNINDLSKLASGLYDAERPSVTPAAPGYYHPYGGGPGGQGGAGGAGGVGGRAPPGHPYKGNKWDKDYAANKAKGAAGTAGGGKAAGTQRTLYPKGSCFTCAKEGKTAPFTPEHMATHGITIPNRPITPTVTGGTPRNPQVNNLETSFGVEQNGELNVDDWSALMEGNQNEGTDLNNFDSELANTTPDNVGAPVEYPDNRVNRGEIVNV